MSGTQQKRAVVDFTLHGEGPMTSVYLLTPHTDEAREWLDQNIGREAQYLGLSLAIEHRCVDAVVDGIMADGLSVE